MEKEPIKIVDVIHKENTMFTQTFLVLSRMPDLLYERKVDLLIGNDSGFYHFYKYEEPRGNWSRAFAGRKFDIPMVDGSVIKAHGQWWDSLPLEFIELKTYGVSIIKDLNKCNIFVSFALDPKMIADWTSRNNASNNYNKYNTNHEDYAKHRIENDFNKAIIDEKQ